MFRRVLNILLSAAIMAAIGMGLLWLMGRAEQVPIEEEPDSVSTEFALFARQTYSTKDRPKFLLSYRNIDRLDFRVYRIDKPDDFFKRLGNLHQFGEQDELGLIHKVTALEKFSTWKFNTLQNIRNFVRRQVSLKARVEFHDKYKKQEDQAAPRRAPLNHSDFEAIPLLNSYGLVESWRERLPKLAQADYSSIPLATQRPGLYLVEAAFDKMYAYTLVFVTDLGIVTKTWNNQIVAFAVNRVTGAPIQGASVGLLYEKQGEEGEIGGEGEEEPNANQNQNQNQNQNGNKKKLAKRVFVGEGKTDKDGVWKAAKPNDAGGEGLLLVAAHEEHFTAIDLNRSIGYWDGDSENSEAIVSDRVYVYTDRPVYRPAHTVYYKAMLRQGTDKGYGIPAEKTADVKVTDSSNKVVHQASLPINSNGTINGSFDLDENASLGSYGINVVSGGMSSYFYFYVEEYKKPEYKVSVTFKEKRVIIGTPATATIAANYYFGAPVTNAAVTYRVYRNVYYPPWQREEDEDELTDLASEGEEMGDEGYSYGDYLITEGEGALNKEGKLDVKFETKAPEREEAYYAARDYSYRVEATITDAARRDITEAGAILATRGNFTLSVSTDQYLYKPTDQIKVTVRAADYDGKPISAPIKVQFLRYEWSKEGKARWSEKPIVESSAKTGADGTADLSIAAGVTGEMRIIAIAQDENRTVVSPSEYVWISGDGMDEYYSSSENYDIKLVPDKKSYKPGDTARILATLPDADTHLIVGIEGKKLLKSRIVSAQGKSAVLEVSIDRNTIPEGVPNVFITVSYVKNSKLHTGSRSINVPPIERMLDVQILPDKKEYQPREVATYTIVTRDQSGKPVPAEVSLGVVDEAIYAIQPERVQNIKPAFYSRIYNYVSTSFSSEYEFSGYSSKQAWNLALRDRLKDRAPFADMKPGKVQVRKNFKDTAFWNAVINTDATGRAKVEFDLPDNLTTWRATARAITPGTLVGSAVERVLSRKNLLVRLATPRFFTEGDVVTVSAIVHNYLKSTQQVKISLEVRGIQISSGPPSTTASIASNGETRIDWQVKATALGDAVLTAKAIAEKESDGVELTLPVQPHGLRIGHSESAVLSDNEAQASLKTTIGSEATPNSPEIRVDISPSIAGAAFGALDYLTSFPYGCVEQTMSGFLPNVIVTRAVKDTGGAATISGDDLAKKTYSGLRRLYDFQHADNGWGWWKEDATDPYMTAHVVSGIAEAGRAGYKIDEARLKRGRDWIRNELDRDRSWREPIGLDDRVYLLYALVTSGKEDAARVEGLAASADKLQPLSLAMLALSFDAVGNRARAAQIASKLESAATGNSVETYWISKRRPMLDYEEDASLEATAFAVKTLAKIAPQSAALPRAARWLVNHRSNGYYWNSTKHTAFAIDALVDYARASGELQANYDWELTINGKAYSSGHVGASEARAGKPIAIKLKREEIRNGANEAVVVKRGTGALYASLTSHYFTNESDVKAAGSDAMSVGREYFRLTLGTNNSGQAVLNTSKFDGNAKSGDLILVRLTLDGKPAKYLMLEDPFPAGTEPFTDESTLPGRLPQIDWANWGWARKEFHDDHAAFFITRFEKKTVWQYVLRVQVPGVFRTAPARGERMYQPDVRANSASARMQIIDK